MRNIKNFRTSPGNILAIGNYLPGYQAIIDFDYLCGKDKPSIVGIVSKSGRFQKFFWGEDEVLIPYFPSIESAKQSLGAVEWMLNISSGRRAYASSVDFFHHFPDSLGGHIFAEDVPEQHALALQEQYQKNGKTIIGPAGVGLLIPGSLKLGAIGGVDHRQLEANNLSVPGSIAILSASGGMINELITITARSGHTISFALCFGGDRFPATTPKDAFLAAESDPKTTHIVYYGELGGTDEYEVVELINTGQVTKPVICYIAGVIGEMFEQPIQFGHAKALASSRDETASAKRQALSQAGATVASSMEEFDHNIAQLPKSTLTMHDKRTIATRHASKFSSTISAETADGYTFVGKSLQSWATTDDIATQITAGLLGKQATSSVTTDFIRTVFLLSIDHGPQVSGAVTTMITARAGKGLVDSLAAGLLTIGPRFGGAVTDAAREWLDGIHDNRDPIKHIESYAKKHKYISGIGHKKYRLGLPDPRTALLAQFTERLPRHRYYDYAKSIETVTSAKKGTLILNVDGTIAALMLDILEQEEKYSVQELREMVEADFFNALFVIPRTVGFISHYLDQKRIDEGLFRLPDDDILLA